MEEIQLIGVQELLAIVFQLDGDKNEMFWKYYNIEINQTLNINSYVRAMIDSVLHKQ